MAPTADETFVPGDDGYVSSDSSFYGWSLQPEAPSNRLTRIPITTGDDSLRSHLEELSSSFDPSTYWKTQHLRLSSIAATNVAKAAMSSSNKPLYNPYEGILSARQLAETVPDFLSRLPPLSTPISTGPWLWIANPYSSHRPTSSDWAGFMTAAQRLLSEFSKDKARIEASKAGRPQATITKAITPLRKTVEKSILAAAKEKGCTTGKWMLFPLPDRVNGIWKLVAESTASGELGKAAKVGTDDGRGESAARLVCVYTEDFSDGEDVKRVLRKMKSIGLLDAAGRDIYYKCDAYTNLGIDSKNEWGIKPSLFSSKDVLAEGRK